MIPSRSLSATLAWFGPGTPAVGQPVTVEIGIGVVDAGVETVGDFPGVGIPSRSLSTTGSGGRYRRVRWRRPRQRPGLPFRLRS